MGKLFSFHRMLWVAVIVVFAYSILQLALTPPPPMEVTTFKIIAVGEHDTAIVRWVDGTLMGLPINGAKVDKNLEDLKGAHLVVKHQKDGLGSPEVLEVKK